MTVAQDLGATRAEICVMACAEVWRGDGEIIASPFGIIPSLGARLARLTFEPDLVLTDGEAALMVGAPPLAAGPEELVREAPMPYRRIFDVVWSGRRHVMMIPTQIDRTGNQNISRIGGDASRPRTQLIGVRGAPGNTVNHVTSYWVPSHSPRSFVAEVDVVCGVGYRRAAEAGAAATQHHEIRRVISNLGVFDFETPDHAMRVRSLHPGVTVSEVQEATGFALVIPDDVPATAAPDNESLDILQGVLDPGGRRDGELPA